MKYQIIKLIVSIIIDLIGIISYIFPFIGELSDVIWAPISGLLIYLMYGKGIYSVIGFSEEFLPFTDFIPTATIVWFINKYKK